MFIIRDMVEEDKSFIFATWLLGLRHGNDLYKEIDKKTYFDKYKLIIELLLSRSSVKIACLDDDYSVVLGYVVFDNDRLHWIFTKRAWRKLGIAKSLFPPNIKRTSHLTKIGKSILPKEIKYDPF